MCACVALYGGMIVIDMKNMEACRLCSQSNQLILDTTNATDLLNKIKEHLSITIRSNDGLPTGICFSCIETINSWCNFRKKCLLYQSKLHAASCKRQDFIKVIEYKEEIGDEFDIKPVIHESNNPSVQPLAKAEILYVIEEDISDDDWNNNVEFPNWEVPEICYICDICDEEFKGCFEYLDHQYTHNGEPDVFKCDKCADTFSRREDLVRHDTNHKTICPICAKMVSRSSMKQHLTLHSDKFKCSTCGHHMGSQSNLDQHIKIVHMNIKNQICHTCGKSFPSNSSLNLHLKIHNDKRNYSCTQCNYSGKTASALYAHVRSHSNDNIPCTQCPKRFQSQRHLKTHIRRVHVAFKSHECTFCSKKFVTKPKLARHTRIHTGCKPYECKFCKKKFTRSDARLEHERLHTKKEELGLVYQCMECNRKFISEKELKTHIC